MSSVLVVKEPAGRLILDGPVERISAQLDIVHEKTGRAYLKKEFSSNFQIQVARLCAIPTKSVSEFLANLDPAAIEVIEKKVTARGKFGAWLERAVWLGLLVSQGVLLVWSPFAALMIAGLSVGVSIWGPLVCLAGRGEYDFPFNGKIRYMKDRKKLKKIYGDHYFLIPGLLVSNKEEN